MHTPLDRYYFIHSVTVAAFQGISGNGKPLYANPVKRAARIEPRTEIVKNPQGVEVVARGFVLFPAGYRAPAGSKISFEGTEYSLISLEPIFGWEEDHVEGWLE